MHRDSFVKDVERHLSLLGGDNLLDEDAPDQVLHSSRLSRHHRDLRHMDSALGFDVASGSRAD